MTESETQHQKSRDLSVELAEGGSEIAGAAVGGALGLLGGPVGVGAGAVSGVLVTRTLKRVGAEFRERVLGPRQAVRIGAAYAFAAEEIGERLNAGDAPRSDGFFEPKGARRSDADELLEGVLLHAGSAYEERKVHHLGYLYAAIAFEPRISAEYGHYLVKLADALTFRQLASMAFFKAPDLEKSRELLDVERAEGRRTSTPAIVAELDELGMTGVLGVLQTNGAATRPTNVWGSGSFAEIELARAGLTSVGEDLYGLMKLDRVSRDDQQAVLQELRGGPRPPSDTF